MKIIAATLSTSLFWFYVQVYCDDHHIKRFEMETFPLVNLETLTSEDFSAVSDLYDAYLADIERNVEIRTSSAKSSYNVTTFKNYKLVRSKPLIDALDDLIGTFYGLTAEEINFVKNFELAIRMSGADDD